MAAGPFKGVVSGGVTGYIQDVSYAETTETAEGLDQNGNVAFYSNFNRQADLTFSVLTGATAAPNTGATFTATSATQSFTGVTVSGNTRITGTYTITGVDITENNKDFRKLSIKGHRYLANSLP